MNNTTILLAVLITAIVINSTASFASDPFLKSYRDEKGKVWSQLIPNEDGQIDRQGAIEHCQKLQGRVPTEKEYLDLSAELNETLNETGERSILAREIFVESVLSTNDQQDLKNCSARVFRPEVLLLTVDSVQWQGDGGLHTPYNFFLSVKLG